MEDKVQNICAGYLVSDQWRLAAIAISFLFVAAGWTLATKVVFALVRKGWLK